MGADRSDRNGLSMGVGIGERVCIRVWIRVTGDIASYCFKPDRRCCIIQHHFVRKPDSFVDLWPLGVRNADALRHAQVRHAIECGAPNPHLRGLGRHLPAAQTVAKNRFLPKHHRLRE
jgi:hypothetical protein